VGCAALAAGCAAAPTGAGGEKTQTAQAKKQLYCQTDDSTGSRLAPRTKCTDTFDGGDAQEAMKEIQSRGVQGQPLSGQ
jgi:hypothetical protein